MSFRKKIENPVSQPGFPTEVRWNVKIRVKIRSSFSAGCFYLITELNKTRMKESLFSAID